MVPTDHPARAEAGLKVLQVHNRYRQGGGEDVAVEREAAVLRNGGHEVLQFQVENPSDHLAAARKLSLAPWNPGARGSIEEVTAGFQPDVAHVHNTWFSLSPSVFGGLSNRGVPTVMSLHNYRLMCVNGLLLRDGAPCERCVGSSALDGVRFRCYRDSYVASAIAALTLGLNRANDTWDSVAVFLANSPFVKQTYVDAGFSSEKIDVKPNFADDPGPRRRPANESSTVLYVGRLSSEKGIGFLLDLWGRTDPALALRVVGDGPLLDDLRTRHPDVEFVGSLPPERVREEMLDARALVFPSITYETCPLVILEAFAAGIPVLASRRGPMSDLLANVGEEWLREPGEADDWAEGVRLLADDQAIAVAGERARADYRQRFTPQIALERLESAYARAMHRGQTRGRKPW